MPATKDTFEDLPILAELRAGLEEPTPRRARRSRSAHAAGCRHVHERTQGAAAAGSRSLAESPPRRSVRQRQWCSAFRAAI